MTISRFQGETRWLSNFWPCQVFLCGLVYPTTEHAYQAAKTKDPNERAWIQSAPTPAEAKRRGMKVTMRPDWDKVKIRFMLDLTRQKFTDLVLRQKLLDTGDQILIEGNTWGDTFWGVCNGIGQNWLGRILMHVRDELRAGVRKEFPGGTEAST